jgi:SagB-type dehydrogenase family enzyme
MRQTINSGHALDQVIQYHERTKHRINHYARSLGYLDWATQPNPFRLYEGAKLFRLLHPPTGDEPAYDDLFARTEKTSKIPPCTLDRDSVSQLYYDSLAISAWKQAPGTARWSLRVNPSSGDLHPTEAYLIAGPIAGLSKEAAIYHYAPLYHALERRVTLSTEQWRALAELLPNETFLVALTSIYWRESWKYGERAFRYCHHDVGHAIGALTVAAATLGWHTRVLDVADSELSLLLGIDRQTGPEREHADCLLAIYVGISQIPAMPIRLRLPQTLRHSLAEQKLEGEPNHLSESHHPWPIIDEVAQVTRHDVALSAQKSYQHFSESTLPASLCSMLPRRPISARRIIRQRRSAVAMDGRTSIDRQTFYHMMARVNPNCFAFRVLPWSPRVSLAIFVRRVTGIPPGLYMLIRDRAHFSSLKASMSEQFVWEPPPDCPTGLALYLLLRTDVREAARVISCHQNIASDGAFALGMLADFEEMVQNNAPWWYPRLFWETGLIGQILYLEAEAAGLRATGIGCFFDDAMHALLEMQTPRWQSLYHFTVGGAVDDPRLKTLPAYAHLGNSTGQPI